MFENIDLTLTGHTLREFAAKLDADPRLLHLLVATAKKSNSPVVRYGAVALDEYGNVAGTGYSKLVETDAETHWGDAYTPPRLHAEMGALCAAQQSGHDITKLKLYILPLSPADNPAKPAGYILLRDMEHVARFSCSSCGPKLARLGIEVNVLNGKRGWQCIAPEQAQKDGERLDFLQEETGRRCRAGSIPGSIITDPPLDAPGYRYIPALLTDMADINLPMTEEQQKNYTRDSQDRRRPPILKGGIIAHGHRVG